jgi:hypothetical protein
MFDRVSVNRKESQAFVAESQELLEHYQELLGKLNSRRDITG